VQSEGGNETYYSGFISGKRRSGLRREGYGRREEGRSGTRRKAAIGGRKRWFGLRRME